MSSRLALVLFHFSLPRFFEKNYFGLIPVVRQRGQFADLGVFAVP